MSFESVLAKRFPGTLPEEAYVDKSVSLLRPLGFSADNTIAWVGVCRDELCRSLTLRAQGAWGEDFSSGSLAGMLFLGKTGMRAAQHHAPQDGGRERYVHFAMPHVGIGPNGEIGQCERIGRPGFSKACGALNAFLADLQGGHVNAAVDPDDIEQSMLRARLVRDLEWGRVPDLVELTYVAHKAILTDLERLLELTLEPERADYAVLTGVQIHGPGNAPHVWPSTSYAVVSGKRHTLSFSG